MIDAGEDAAMLYVKHMAGNTQHAHTRARTNGEVTIQSLLSLLPVQYTLVEDPYTRLLYNLSQHASQTQAVAMAMGYKAQYTNMKVKHV